MPFSIFRRYNLENFLKQLQNKAFPNCLTNQINYKNQELTIKVDVSKKPINLVDCETTLGIFFKLCGIN